MDQVLQLLQQVVEENKQLKEEINSLKESMISLHQKFDGLNKPVKKNKNVSSVVVQEREQCSGMTAKGTRCKNLCVQDGKCRMHANQSETVAVQQKPKKQKKVKTQLPTHTHAPGEQPVVYCQLCETHGDILDPELPERQFEIVYSDTQEEQEEQEEEQEEYPEDDPFMDKLSSLIQTNITPSWADDEDDFF